MCGICGGLHRDPAATLEEATILRMCDAIAHRGPDDAGIYRAPGVALGSRRLAILDRSTRGHMPMRTPDGRFHIVYNGEVYNAPTLRRELEGQGCRFESHSDTEVVLQLYARHGPAMLERLNGMFAIAIWDARERTCFLARDRLGVKPLFYALDGESLLFASEPKALFAAGVPPQAEPRALPELLAFRYVAGERTPFRGVRRLLPGHYLLWRDGRARTVRWWSLAVAASAIRAGIQAMPEAPVPWFRATFDDAVDSHRLSDVPIGVLLSGGLDSGSVAAALATRAGQGVSAFTVTFDEPGYDEGPLARQVAERWGLDLHTLTVPRGEMLDRLLEASWLGDEPLAHGNEVHLRAIAGLARPLVTVLLSGEGADETLGGYVRYRPLHHPGLLGMLAAPGTAGALRLLGPRGRKLGRLAALGGQRAWVLYNACDVLPADLEPLGLDGDDGLEYRARVLDEARALYPGRLPRQAMYLDQHTFLSSLLDRNDRMTMGASIECRVPFLDVRLVEGAAALSDAALLAGRRAKRLLREGVGDRLPPAVLQGRKWGFGTPWAGHLRAEAALREVVEQLPSGESFVGTACDRIGLRRLVQRFVGGDDAAASLVRQLVMVELWHRACVAGRTGAPSEAPLGVPVA